MYKKKKKDPYPLKKKKNLGACLLIYTVVYDKVFSHFRFTSTNGNTYDARVAFQALIAPDCYTCGPETVRVRSQLDPNFSNDEIEWMTEQQGSTILYGLLVKLEPF